MAEYVELKLYVVAETAAAWGVTEDGPEDPVTWLPKSRVDAQETPVLDKTCTFDVPEWMAIEKGLV